MATSRNVLLCDLDGTLVDSAPDLETALNHLLDEVGRPHLPRGTVTELVGDGAKVMIERGFALTGPAVEPESLPSLVARYVEIYDAISTVETRPYPHAVEVLSALRDGGWRLAVCTNKLESLSRRILEGLGIDGLFDAVAGGDSYPVRKPDPGHVMHLLAELGAAPEQAVMLGDSRNDFLAGREAGLPVVLVSFGYGKGLVPGLGAERVIDSYLELPGALAGLPATALRSADPAAGS